MPVLQRGICKNDAKESKRKKEKKRKEELFLLFCCYLLAELFSLLLL
jgi:hypothetical protein